MKSRATLAQLLALVGLAGACSDSTRVQAGGRIEADPERLVEISDDGFHHAGDVGQDDGVEHTFLLTNVGDRTVELGYLWQSCKCTSLSIDKQRIEPGESAALTASVHFNSLDFGLQTIDGAVFETEGAERPLARFLLQARVGRAAILVFDRSHVELEHGPLGLTPVELGLEVVSLEPALDSRPSLRFEPPVAGLTATLDEVPQVDQVRGQTRRRFTVRLADEDVGGNAVHGALVAELDLEGDVLRDRVAFSVAARPFLELSEQSLFLGSIAAGERQVRALDVLTAEVTPGPEFELLPSQDWIEASFPGGDSLVVAVAPPGPGRLDESVQLRWRDRSLTLPIRGWVTE